MLKSYTQQKLEAQRGGDIREIVIESLRQHRGLWNMVMLVSVDLEITDTTLYRWCDELGIDMDEYRRPAVAAEKAVQEANECWVSAVLDSSGSERLG